MRVLVTGGSGFLGAWIIKRLIEAGAEPVVFDISGERRKVAEIAGARTARELVWVVGDVRNADDVRMAVQGCQGVIHLAGLLTPACAADPVRGAEVNLIGTLNVFEAARRQGLQAVAYASTAGVFGPDDAQHPRPITHYGAFKLAAEACARAFWHDAQLPSVGLRPLVVYGPGRDLGLSAGPSLACRAAARGEAYEIGFTGETGLVYVEDVAAAFAHAVLHPGEGAHVFNLIGEVARVDALLAEIRRQVPDARLSAAGPGLGIAVGQGEAGLDDWFPGRPVTSLAQGVARTLAHYRAAADLRVPA